MVDQVGWMQVTAGGTNYEVPSHTADAAFLLNIYGAIRALMPKAVWDKLMRRREQYMGSRCGDGEDPPP